MAWSLVEGGRPGFWAIRERKPISLVSRQLDIMIDRGLRLRCFQRVVVDRKGELIDENGKRGSRWKLKKGMSTTE